MNRVFVVGVGMTKFQKSGTKEGDYPLWAKEAILKALEDSKLSFSEIEQATVGYMFGDSACGQRAIYEVGTTGIPIYNVHNNCCSGGTALALATQFIKGNLGDCALAVGFEKMERGSLKVNYTDKASPVNKHCELMVELAGFSDASFPVIVAGSSGIEHMKKYGSTPEHFAKIAWKNHKHSVNNPDAQFQDEYTLEQIMSSQQIFGPITKLQCCPTSDGASAVIVASEKFVRSHGLEAQAVEILALEMVTDFPSTFSDKSCIKIAGYDLTKTAAERAYRKSGVSPGDIQVIELHDAFSANELITYEALGLCPEGKAGEFIDRGDNTYGGKYVINPSGGLISKGHPLSATGLAQCAELCWQLRGLASARQVPNVKIALQHNFGLGAAVIVAIYTLGFPEHHTELKGT